MLDEALPKHRIQYSILAKFRIVLLLLALPVIFTCVAVLMFINTDVHAPKWMKSRIEDRVDILMQGGSLEFGEIFFNIGTDLHPHIRLIDTKVTDADGLLVARIPSIEGVMSPRGLLFEGEVLMQDIALHGAQINLKREVDGSVAFAFDDGGFDSAPSLGTLLGQLDQFFERSSFVALEQISASGLIINYVDARAGLTWTVDGGELNLNLRSNQTSLYGDFALLSGGADITRLQLNYESARGSRAAQLGVFLVDARASDIATQIPSLAWLSGFDTLITASLRSGLDENGAIGPLSATLNLGAGALQPNVATDRLVFETAKVYLTYDPTTDLIEFNQIELDTAVGKIRANGRAYLREKLDGVPQALVAQFTFPDIILPNGNLYPDGLVLPPLSVDMRLRFEPFVVELGQVVLGDGDTHVIGSGQIIAAQDGWQATIDVQADKLNAAQLMSFWPKTVKPGSRAWLVRNVDGGVLRDVEIGARFFQGRGPIIEARYNFEDADITFMQSMPSILGARGIGYMKKNQMFLSLDHGSITAAQGGRVDLSGSTFKVLDTRISGGDAELDLVSNSTITAALSLLDREPFAFITEAERLVTMTEGFAVATGLVEFPLRQNMRQDQIKYEITADLLNMFSKTIVKGRDLRSNRMFLQVNNTGMRIEGPVSLDGIAAETLWVKRFGPDNVGKSQMRASVILSGEVMDTFNIMLPGAVFTGSSQGELIVDMMLNQPANFRLNSDLKGLEVSLPPIGWRKPLLSSGNFLVVGTLGDAAQITGLEISVNGLEAKGTVALNADGTLNVVRFSRLKISDWLDAKVTLQGRGKGQPNSVSIEQGSVDLRGAAFGLNNGDGGPMRLRLEKLQITEGIALHDFRGEFSGMDGFSGEFTGLVNGGPQVFGTVVEQEGQSVLHLRSNDAGGVIGAAGFIKNGLGGSLRLMLRSENGVGTFDGELDVRDLRVRDVPAMAALLDSISVVGLLRQLDGQGIAFDEVDATFRLTPSEVIVTKASAVGPGLGISLDGIYTVASKQIDFQGVVSPFYLLNGLGAFLTRKGEGLIGFNFSLKGPSAAPVVSVNPLSAFTPGMFREIFRRAPPEVTQ